MAVYSVSSDVNLPFQIRLLEDKEVDLLFLNFQYIITNEWQDLCHEVKDLSLQSQLIFTWNGNNVHFDVFEDGLLRQGKYHVSPDRVFPHYRFKEVELGHLEKVPMQDAIANHELQKMFCNDFIHFELRIFGTVIYQETYSPRPAMFDVEIDKENLVEHKHRTLYRNHRTLHKPNAKTRDILKSIGKMTTMEKDLVWNYRYYLQKDKNMLLKFYQSVAWQDPVESKQAIEIMESWAQPDIHVVLELLGPNVTNKSVRSYAVKQIQKTNLDNLKLYLLQIVQALKFETNSLMFDYVVHRAQEDEELSILMYWYLAQEQDTKLQELKSKFLTLIRREYLETLKRQQHLVLMLTRIQSEVKSLRETRQKKIQRLKELLKNQIFPSLPLPLDPKIKVTGLNASKASIFKSSMMPLLLCFNLESGQEYFCIFKHGDDLRQDQLVMQLLEVMNSLLLRENLDLKLTLYKVLATAPDQGFVEYIDSESIASVLEKHSSITSKLKNMDTYLRSCAGYCVITYLLGVGDRHLDNLMLKQDGNLFHIDFGYILNRDPKPFPPPMKLCKEMVEAMGGLNSKNYQEFKNYCFVAFGSLRKNALWIINLLNLMSDANIPDIAMEPDKVGQKIMDKFRFDLNEEEALLFFGSMISESVNALFPQVLETIHKWAQYWRN